MGTTRSIEIKDVDYNSEGELEKIILKYPNKVEFKYLSANPCVSIKFIDFFFYDFPWNFEKLSYNPNLTFEFIKKHSNTLDGHSIKWNWDAISAFSNLNESDIDNNPECDWSYHFLSANNNISIEYIEKHFDKFKKYFFWLSYNHNVTSSFVEKYINESWNFLALSCNPNLSVEFLNKYWGLQLHQYKNEMPKKISVNPKLTLEFIDTHPNIKWNWKDISKNKFHKHPKFNDIEIYSNFKISNKNYQLL